MSLDEQTVRKIFSGLEHGDGDAFFSHVADDVDWTVMGTHPLAGHYLSKAAFKAGTFSKLGKVLPGGAQLNVTHVFVAGDTAVVELVSAATAQNGMRFDNHYCWVVRFEQERIVEIRAYLDSALVAELFRQNPV
jgi:ketosteroid isomerase-like protein